MVLFSCSTRKNTFTSRVYHNLTARYNVYFNGKEAYKAGVKTIATSHKDNFSNIIPMYSYSDKTACTSAAGNMQRAIDKSQLLIKRHSITAKPKMHGQELLDKQKQFYAKRDFCNWVDDAYLLIGKSYLMKHDYFNANKNLEIVANEFKNAGLRIPARLWLARSKTEEGLTDDAIEILDKLTEDPKFPIEYKPEVLALYANAYIKAENYGEAILKLEEAIPQTKPKSLRLRFTYILAQLYQITNDNSKAQQLFTQLLKMGLSNEMAFNAKINLATSFESGNSNDVKKMLKKLLRDVKYKDFRDQIYFAYANISMKEGQNDLALEQYKQSIVCNVSNKYQKSMSYLAIGNIYYDKKQYIDAQPYYDSCVTLLDETTRNYQAIVTKSKNLNDLAKYYNIVTTEDSLQRMAKMSPSERNSLIDKAIKTLLDKEEAERRIENEAAQNPTMLNNPIGANDASASTKWYFYNPSVVALGKMDFVKQWGSRKLEDNWRRKNKAIVAQNEESEESETTDSTGAPKKQKLSNKSRDFYMQNVPVTDSAMLVSNTKVENALFATGTVFMNKIEDYSEAIKTFENFDVRFPNSAQLVMSYYNLYTLYNLLGNKTKADYYKDLITNKFASTKYAQAITNPNFFRDSKARESKIETIFKRAYKAYFQENYSDLNSAVAEVQKDYPDCGSMPKFEMLQAMSRGRMATTAVMIDELNKFIDKYPKDDASDLAKKIIAYLNDKKQEGNDPNAPISKLMKDSTSVAALEKSAEKKKEELPLYTYQDGVAHYFIISADADAVQISRIKFNLINYNLEYFSNFPFEVTEKTLGKRYNIVVVKPFTDNRQALSYYDLTTISDEIFEGVDKSKTEQFVISEQNLNVLMRDYQLEKYVEFFYQNYIK